MRARHQSGLELLLLAECFCCGSTEWRFTEWAEWNGMQLKPVWMKSVLAPDALVELYDHARDTMADGSVGAKIWDDWENENVAPRYPGVVLQLRAQLHAHFRAKPNALV